MSKSWQNAMDHAGDIFEEDAKNIHWARQQLNSATPLQWENLSKPKATPMPTPMSNPKHDQRGQGARSPRGRRSKKSAVQLVGGLTGREHRGRESKGSGIRKFKGLGVKALGGLYYDHQTNTVTPTTLDLVCKKQWYKSHDINYPTELILKEPSRSVSCIRFLLGHRFNIHCRFPTPDPLTPTPWTPVAVRIISSYRIARIISQTKKL